MDLPVRTIHNRSRPGQSPRIGDVVEIETPTGFIMAVDPHTRQATDRVQQFMVRRAVIEAAADSLMGTLHLDHITERES